MSLVPYLLHDLLEDVRRPTLYDQHFGLGISPFDLVSPGALSVPLRSGYMRPWRHLATADSGISNIVNDKDNFKVNLDVQQFKPEEITVKVADNIIVVEAKHEERGDEHGYVSRHFVRKYKLPQNCDETAISTTLSSDGVLQLVAPKKAVEPSSERIISITQTNKPALKPKEAAESKTD